MREHGKSVVVQPESITTEERLVFANMMQDAYLRCKMVAQGEELLGYKDSAQDYMTMALECTKLGEFIQSNWGRERKAA